MECIASLLSWLYKVLYRVRLYVVVSCILYHVCYSIKSLIVLSFIRSYTGAILNVYVIYLISMYFIVLYYICYMLVIVLVVSVNRLMYCSLLYVCMVKCSHWSVIFHFIPFHILIFFIYLIHKLHVSVCMSVLLVTASPHIS